MIVGEGGCSAEYFLNKMSIDEAHSYISGLDRRHRQSWEQTRSLCRLVYGVLSGDELDWNFPWDNEGEDEESEATEEQLDALRAKARMMERIMNKES